MYLFYKNSELYFWNVTLSNDLTIWYLFLYIYIYMGTLGEKSQCNKINSSFYTKIWLWLFSFIWYTLLIQKKHNFLTVSTNTSYLEKRAFKSNLNQKRRWLKARPQTWLNRWKPFPPIRHPAVKHQSPETRGVTTQQLVFATTFPIIVQTLEWLWMQWPITLPGAGST